MTYGTLRHEPRVFGVAFGMFRHEPRVFGVAFGTAESGRRRICGRPGRPIYADSETATGAKAASEEEKRAVRRELQWVLYQNLQAIVALYPRQPERTALYMQPHLLGFPQGGGGSSDGDDDAESSGPTS